MQADNPISWIILFILAIIFLIYFFRLAEKEKIQKRKEEEKFWESRNEIFWD